MSDGAFVSITILRKDEAVVREAFGNEQGSIGMMYDKMVELRFEDVHNGADAWNETLRSRGISFEGWHGKGCGYAAHHFASCAGTFRSVPVDDDGKFIVGYDVHLKPDTGAIKNICEYQSLCQHVKEYFDTAEPFVPEKPPMTQRKYNECVGTKCPNCESDQIEGDSIDVDGAVARQEMSCINCSSTWTDSWTRSGYYELVIPEAKKETEDK